MWYSRIPCNTVPESANSARVLLRDASHLSIPASVGAKMVMNLVGSSKLLPRSVLSSRLRNVLYRPEDCNTFSTVEQPYAAEGPDAAGAGAIIGAGAKAGAGANAGAGAKN